jgi:hypothetical protein
MAVYHVYKLRDDGPISGAPHVIDCRDDEAAMREARRLLRGDAHEVRECTAFEFRGNCKYVQEVRASLKRGLTDSRRLARHATPQSGFRTLLAAAQRRLEPAQRYP